MVDRRLALDLDLFSRGGMRVLEKIEQQDYDVLARASGDVTRSERVGLLLGSLARVAFSTSGMSAVDANPTQYCRSVARTQAKNFYYSFVLLAGQQREAMCAIYAFMRYCDDLSDEPGAPTRQPWSAGERSWKMRSRATRSDHPFWPAFHDTVRRFGIPHEYFHEMIDGVSSDLRAARASKPSTNCTATATRWRRWWG